MGWEVIEDNLPMGDTVGDLPKGYIFDADFFNTFLEAGREKGNLVYPKYPSFAFLPEYTKGEAWTNTFRSKVSGLIDNFKFMFNGRTWVKEELYNDPVLWPTSDGSSIYELDSSDAQAVMTTKAYDVIFGGQRNDWDIFLAEVWAGVYELYKLMRFHRTEVRADDESNLENRPHVRISELGRADDPLADGGNANTDTYQGKYPPGDLPSSPRPTEADYEATKTRAKTGWDTYYDDPNINSVIPGIELVQEYDESRLWDRPGFDPTPWDARAFFGDVKSIVTYPKAGKGFRVWCYGERVSDSQKIALAVRCHRIVGRNNIVTSFDTSVDPVINTIVGPYYASMPQVNLGDGTTEVAGTLTQGIEADEGYCEMDPTNGESVKSIDDPAVVFNNFQDPNNLVLGNNTSYGEVHREYRTLQTGFALRAIVDINAVDGDFYIP